MRLLGPTSLAALSVSILLGDLLQPAAVRTVLAVVFFAFAPGAAVVLLVGLPNRLAGLAVSIALSLALTLLVASAAAFAGARDSRAPATALAVLVLGLSIITASRALLSSGARNDSPAHEVPDHPSAEPR